jgi:cell wall-associated NlpC family hydrolase
MTPDEFVEQLRTYVGVPTWHCGRSREGVDCVGLIICAAQDLGVDIDGFERYTADVNSARLQARMLQHCRRLLLTDELLVGDLLLFNSRDNPQHVAVLSESGRSIIHAWDTVGRVVETELTPAWRRSLHSAYRWRCW